MGAWGLGPGRIFFIYRNRCEKEVEQQRITPPKPASHQMHQVASRGVVLNPGWSQLLGIVYRRLAFKPSDAPGWLQQSRPVSSFALVCWGLCTAGWIKPSDTPGWLPGGSSCIPVGQGLCVAGWTLSHQMHQAGLQGGCPVSWLAPVC